MKIASSVLLFVHSRFIYSPRRPTGRHRAWAFAALGLVGLLTAMRAWAADCAVPPTGLVSWWRAETNTLDMTGLDNGTPVGGVGYAPGKVGLAFSFNGTDAEVRLGTSMGNFGTNDFTIEFWMQTSSTRDHESVLGERPACDGNSTGFWDMRIRNGRLEMELMAPGVTDHNSILATRQINDGVYHHVAFVRQGTNGTLYIDGAFEVSGSTPGVTYLNTSGECVIGRSACVGVDGTQYFTGLLDEITVYQHALSLFQVQAIYNAGSAGKCTTATTPVLTNQPPSQTVNAGANVSLSVGASGATPLSYQWRLNGTNLDGASTASLVLTNVQLSSAGYYSVQVTNAFGTVTSSNAALVVVQGVAGPLINVDFGGGPTNSSSAEVGPAAAGQAPNDFWNFYTRDNGSGGYTTFGRLSNMKLATGASSGAGLTVLNAPGAYPNGSSDPMYSSYIYPFDGGNVTVTVTNLPAGPYDFYVYGYDGNYQLQVGATNYGTRTSIDAPLMNPPVWQEGRQYALFRGVAVGAGQAVTLTVLPGQAYGYAVISGIQLALAAIPPSIAAQPQSQTVNVGADVSFSVTASGTAVLSYQWRFNGTNLPGKTATSLTLSGVQLTDVGSYSVQVTNVAGSVASSNAVLTVNGGTPCAPLPSGLIGWWKGDGNGMDSAGTNNAYGLVNIAFTNGIVGQAFACDPENYPYGTYTGIRIADHPAFMLTNSLSLEAWIRPRGNGYCVFCRGDHRPGFDPYVLSMEANNIIEFAITDANNNTASVSAPLVYNQWWHVAGTLDGASGKLSLYTNGTLAAQITTTIRPLGDLIPQDYPGIGIGNVNDDFNNFPFWGDIDEVSLYNRALAAGEVQATYNAGSAGKCAASPCVAPPAGLVSWWRGEGNALDQAGTNNGSLLNGVSFDAGVVGQAFRFDGSTNSYVEVPDSPALRLTNALTIECWAKRLNNSEIHVLVEKGGDWTGGQTDFEIGLNDTYWGGSHYAFCFAGGWRGCAVTPDTAWHHYAAVAVSGQADPVLYIDGIPQTITYRGGPATMNFVASTRPLHIGAQLDPQTGWYYYSSTMMDEVGIYNRALAAAEIQAIYNAGSAGKCTPTPPAILLQPTNQIAAVSGNASFSVLATGTQPLAYQWRFNGTNLAAATDSSLVLSNVQLAAAGSYSVLVSNSVGTLLSSNAILTVNPPPPCAAPPPGLVSWWRGENSTADNVGGNNGAVAGYGTFGYAPGVVGQAFVFDGIHRDRVDAGNPASLQLQVMTIEAWVKRSSPTDISLDDDNQDGAVSGEGGIVFGYGRYGYGFGLLNNGQLFLSRIDVDNVLSTNVVADTNWHHVAVSKTGSTAVFYIDGTPASGAIPYATTNTFDTSAAIGSRGDARGGTFWGMVDEPAVYGRALSGAEIQAVYAAGAAGKCSASSPCAPLPSGLIGWWKGDGNGMDSAGTNNAYGLVNIAFTNGIVGQAFACDPENYPYGTYTGILLADQPAYVLTNSLSIEAWIRPRGASYCVFCRGDNRPGFDPYVLSMEANNIIEFAITDANGNSASVSAPLTYNLWWHVAGTLDGASGKLSLYTNGTLAAQITTAVRPLGDLIPQDSPGIGIGNVNDGFNNFPFWGDIDEISLYNRALVEGEVQAIYSAGSSGKCVITGAPVILSQPTNQVATVSDNVSFSVGATGTQPLSYQWRFNGTNLAAATTSSLALSNVQLSDAGSYSVLVSNTVGTLLSSNAILTVNPAPPCAVPPLGLVSWWRAETNDLDQAGTNDGTLRGAATFGPGRVGQGFALDGLSSYVEVPSSPELKLAGPFTVEGWVNYNYINSPYGSVIFVKGQDIEAPADITLSITPGLKLRPHVNVPAGWSYFDCSTTLTNGVWYHVAMVYDGASLRGYVNGAMDGTLAVSGPVQTSDYSLRIGAYAPINGNPSKDFFPGKIDELSLYSRALSGAEIQAIYSAGGSGKCVVPTPPVILSQPTNQIAIAGDNITFGVIATGTRPLSYQWRYNGTNLPAATASNLVLPNVQLSAAGSYSVLVSNTGGTLLSSNAILTVNPVPPCAPPPLGLVSWWRAESNALDFVGTNNGQMLNGITFAQGRVGQAFSFDGSSGYVSIPASPSLDLGAGAGMTIECWVNPTSLAGEQALAEWNNGAGPGAHFWISVSPPYGGGAGSVYINLIDTAGSYHWLSSAAGIVQTNSFQHVAMTYDQTSGVASLYYNGGLVASQALGSFVPQTSYDFFFGKRTGPSPIGLLGGALDEMTLYSRALTASEIQAVYAAERSGKCTAPTPPTILMQPTNQIATAQSNAVFTVLAAGTSPLAYQWRYNNAGLAGETNATLALAAVRVSQAGSYDVVITNTAGATTSTVAVLTVYVPPPPVFALQPQSQTARAGTNVTFSALATNAWPVTYQWYFSGTALAGATVTALSLVDIQATNGGDYTVLAADPWSTTTSAVATLTVVATAPIPTLQPQSAGVFLGFPAQLSVAATGTEPFSYQWQLYGTNLPSATNASYAVSNMLPANAGPYQALVSNSAGSTNSAQALLALVPVACWGATPIGLMSLPIGLTNAVAISAGAQHNLALRRDGTVVAWGAADQANLPAGLANVVAVSAGSDHSVALKADGTVLAWGARNATGQTNVPANVTNVVAVAAGSSHNLALKADGTVVGWGVNTSGQTNVPAGLTNIVAISAGSNHSIALRADGKVVAWGSNTYGQTNVPASLADVVAIAAGAAHNLALRSDGTVVAWGASTYGQTNVPTGLSNVIAIGAGAFHSLAVKSDGTLVAWGAGTNSLPSTYPNLGQSFIPASVTNLTAVSGGNAHTLALAGDGPPFIAAQPVSRFGYSGRRVVFRAAASGVLPLSYQWQLNGNDIPGATSQLLVINSATNGGSYRVVVTNLLGATTSLAATLTVVDSPPFVISQPVGQSVFLGGQTLLQVTADGSGPLFYQWRFNGTNIAGATGSSLLLNHLVASQEGNYSVVISNAFGMASSAKATIPVVQVAAWGAGTNYGSSPNYGQSMVPAGLNNAVAIAGGGYHTLVIKADAKVLAWGAGTSNYTTPNYGQSIVPASLPAVVGVAGGLYHSLAVGADGSVAAWGTDSSRIYSPGQLPLVGQSTVPANATNVIAVAAGDYNSFALRSDGKVIGWGYTLYSITNVPAAVSNVVAIAARGSHALALRSDGSMVHWGSLTTLPPTPYNYVAIAAGVNHCLGLRSDGTVVSWGGQYSVPSGLANVVDIAAGYDHSVALRSDGTVVTWGATNTYNRNLIPPGLTNVIGIACGYYNSLAVLGDGSPLIKVQPANRAAYIATPTNFLAMAVGAQPLRFQWQFNGTNLAGATSSSLTLANVYASSAGNYRVIVTNVFGSVTSSVATLTALVPLGSALNSSLVWSTIGNAAWFGESAVTHDGASAAQSGLITDNQTSTLQTTVVGAGTGSFWWRASSEQWFDYLSFYIDGVMQASISGDTGWQQQTFAVANGSHALKWTYAKDSSVSIGADAGWLDQVSFIANPPVITVQPASQHGVMGATMALSVAASGAPPFSYQWLKNGTNLSGATSATFTLPSATRRDSGVYQVVVSNSGGGTPSSNATLVIRSPQKLGPPMQLPGGVLALTSGDADGGPLLPSDLAYFQVQASTNLVDWVALLNCLTVTNGTLLLVDPDGATHPRRFYRIIELDDATLVTNAPVITVQPLSQTLSMGAGIALGVTASGAPPLKYQWLKDGTNVAGATAASLTISNAARHHSGVYVAVVSNPVGATPSSNAVLAVRVPEKLGRPMRLPDGTFTLLAGDADGAGLLPGDLPNFEARASSNLVDWVTLTNSLTLTNGMLQLRDADSTNSPRRFYRIIEQ